MRFLTSLARHLTLLLAVAGVIKAGETIIVRKCCSEFQMVSGDGKSCVKTDWPQNVIFRYSGNNFIVPPLDENWMRLWYPPGVALERVSEVIITEGILLRGGYNIVSVNRSSLWNKHQSPPEDRWKTQAIFNDKFAVRPKPGGGSRQAFFCIDAALPPLAPYVLVFNTECSKEECITKCCRLNYVLVGGKWDCESDDRSPWSPFNSTFTKDIDAEFPISRNSYCQSLQKAPTEYRSAAWAREEQHEFLFSTWSACFDYYRIDGSLEEGLFYCEHPRVERGVYWLLRPLCIASCLLLVVSLISVVCDKHMRRKIHGWCLGCHAACLLGFNTGQLVYFLTISDVIDELRFDIPISLQKTCTPFALFMYFLLTASWFWITVLCVNMSMGFRLQVAAPKRSGRKRFLVFSVFAWGLPMIMTISCYLLFTPRDQIELKMEIPWYKPTLMETRVCYKEPYYISAKGYISVKSGTILFYYGPVGCLVFINFICIVVTLRKVQYLRRGNSVLRREEDEIALRHHQAKGNLSPAVNTEAGNRKTTEGRNGGGRRTTVDTKTIKLYIKMLWMTGVIEVITEIIFWATMKHEGFYQFLDRDYTFVYRASGYVTDTLRAVCVAWLAAPEGGYWSLILRMREKK